MKKLVQVVSHGPHCLDGAVAALAVARYRETSAEVVVRFAGNSEIDAVLRAIEARPGCENELWITDISWRDAATSAHLRALAEAGVRIHWIDHHRTAIERAGTSLMDLPFTDRVLSEDFAASRLAWSHVVARARAEGGPDLGDLERLVMMADDNDRWLHRLRGSRELAWVVHSLGETALPELRRVGPDVTYTPAMQEALDRARADIHASFGVADASRTEREIDGVRIVAAVCDGHPSEIADAWGRAAHNAVFALFDVRSLAVSLRRSPDCEVDLSRLAASLGGGGHAAAAGCQLPEVRRVLAEAVASRIADRLG